MADDNGQHDRVVIGVDGGGSITRALCVTKAGVVLGYAEAAAPIPNTTHTRS